ncbi:MAG: hypothetical protein ACOCP8_09500 [archaeon]
MESKSITNWDMKLKLEEGSINSVNPYFQDGPFIEKKKEIKYWK